MSTPDPTSIATFPARYARTRRFSLGVPRSFTVAPDRDEVLFLRSRGPEDPVNLLWALDATTGTERIVADARAILGGADEDLPPEERARRERARESGGGIVAFRCDRGVTVAVFALSGRLFRVRIADGDVTALPSVSGAYDPWPSPDGERVAYVAGGALHLCSLDDDRVLASDGDDAVTWGVAEWAAAEEMGRQRGYWWSPDGRCVLAARADESSVPTWYIADPAHPDAPGRPLRYPAAGSDSAQVTLHLLTVDGGATTEVVWDRATYPYLARAAWTDGNPPTIAVQTRDQRVTLVLTVDPATGVTAVAREITAAPWVELAHGWPAWLGDGRMVTIEDVARDGDVIRSVVVDGAPVSPVDLTVRDILEVEGEAITYTANAGPLDVGVHRWVAGEHDAVTADPGVHAAAVRGQRTVVVSARLDGPTTRTFRRGTELLAEIASHGDVAGFDVDVRLLELTDRRLPAALLLPSGAGPDDRLPVVLSPYGGPGVGAQRVMHASALFVPQRWLAEQGFAVLVVDGAGMSGRGPGEEYLVAGDFANGPLDDQIAALHAAAELEPRLDLGRVAMRGWSFGGYLAALAVLRRPDVFHAAVAGAPVTDWHLYSTHYTERYLGHPAEQPEAYRRSGLVDADLQLIDAAPWSTEDPPQLLVVHGLADDNVVAAHALRLSSALLADARPHRFLPLSGVSHMTPQAVITENLLRLESAFLREALGLA